MSALDVLVWIGVILGGLSILSFLVPLGLLAYGIWRSR